MQMGLPGSIRQPLGQIISSERGFFFFDSKPLLVKGWMPTMDLQAESIRSLPLWI